MKINDALAQTEIKNKSIKKAMKGGKVDKKSSFIGDKFFGKNVHVGYSYRVDNANNSAWPGLGRGNDY